MQKSALSRQIENSLKINLLTLTIRICAASISRRSSANRAKTPIMLASMNRVSARSIVIVRYATLDARVAATWCLLWMSNSPRRYKHRSETLSRTAMHLPG